MADPAPNFFIVGAPKAGTSALHAALRQHLEVFMPDLKEPHFFGEDHERLNHQRMTWDRYLALFAPSRGEARIGEASTSYLHSASAAQELRAFAPEARIIVMLRDPVEQMYSYHSSQVKDGFETIYDFGEALAAESDRKTGRRLPRTAPGLRETLYYREIATYSPQLARFRAAFGRESVKVVLFDDWLADGAAVFAELAAFLGIDEDLRPAHKIVNANRRLRSARLHRFLNDPPPAAHRAVNRLMPRQAHMRLVRAVARANTRLAPRRPMAPQLEAALREEFAPEVERLGQALDRDLSAWGAPETT